MKHSQISLKMLGKIFSWCKLHICIFIWTFYHCCWCVSPWYLLLKSQMVNITNIHMYIFLFWKKLRLRRGGPCFILSILLCSTEHESFSVLIQDIVGHLLMPNLNKDHLMHRRANQHPYSWIWNELVQTDEVLDENDTLKTSPTDWINWTNWIQYIWKEN